MKSTYFYIITGGPGVGKTALIEELNRQGFSTVPEDARRIIKEQIDLGGDGLPWKDKGVVCVSACVLPLVNLYRQIIWITKKSKFLTCKLVDTNRFSDDVFSS